MTTPGAPSPPPQPLGMGDFFALEAGEYLDRLDALLQPAAPPAADELVRLARALRGSALMASQQGIARAAMGLEALARGVREGRRPWDAATKQITTRAIDDLKIFVRKAASWTDADTARAEALAVSASVQLAALRTKILRSSIARVVICFVAASQGRRPSRTPRASASSPIAARAIPCWLAISALPRNARARRTSSSAAGGAAGWSRASSRSRYSPASRAKKSPMPSG